MSLVRSALRARIYPILAGVALVSTAASLVPGPTSARAASAHVASASAPTSLPGTSIDASRALLTPAQAAASTAWKGHLTDALEPYPVCSELPDGQLCGRTFLASAITLPYPALVALDERTNTAAAARQFRLIRREAGIAGNRETVVQATRRQLVTLDDTFEDPQGRPIAEVSVTRARGRFLVTGDCAQSRRDADTAKLVACATRVERAQERTLTLAS